LAPVTAAFNLSVIPGRASSREPGIQAAVWHGEAVWIPGSACGGPGMTARK